MPWDYDTGEGGAAVMVCDDDAVRLYDYCRRPEGRYIRSADESPSPKGGLMDSRRL